MSPVVTKQFRAASSSAPAVGRLDAMLKPSRDSHSALETVQRFVRIPSASVGALVLLVLLTAAALAPVLTPV